MTSTRLMIFFSLDQASSDEGVPLSGEEETSSKCSYHHRRLPTHVYKEYLPSTIYRTGEARSVRVCIESISQRKEICLFFRMQLVALIHLGMSRFRNVLRLERHVHVIQRMF